jgi:hypothetical protein
MILNYSQDASRPSSENSSFAATSLISRSVLVGGHICGQLELRVISVSGLTQLATYLVELHFHTAKGFPR